jgi:RNA polymerase sigma-70 factor (ECF subfamily)
VRAAEQPESRRTLYSPPARDKGRTFVELYYQRGMETDEIAVEMQISLKTVYSKKHKIRAHLVRCLQGLTGDSPIADLAVA